MSPHRIWLADSSPSLAGPLRTYLEAGGYEVLVSRSDDELWERLGMNSDCIVFANTAGAHGGEALCTKIKQAFPKCQVVLLFPPDEPEADQRASKVSADAFLVGPLKRANVLCCARLLSDTRNLRQRVEQLETELKSRLAAGPAPSAPAPAVEPAAASASGNVVRLPGPRAVEAKVSEAEVTPAAPGSTPNEASPEARPVAADMEFFRRFLLMEVRRSRRYRYPVAFLLVGADPAKDTTKKVDETLLTRSLPVMMVKAVRDIDIVLPTEKGRYLAFLPHTPRQGAITVAERLRRKVEEAVNELDGLTVSIGVASYEPGPSKTYISFGSLMRTAREAFEKAQANGGNRVEAGRNAHARAFR